MKKTRLVAILLVVMMVFSIQSISLAENKSVTFACWWSEAEIAAAKVWLDENYTPVSGIEVEFKYVPYNGFAQQMVSEIASGNPSDLILCEYTMVPSYYDNGLMLPLNDLMARDGVDFTTFNCAEQWIFGDDKQMLALPSEHPMTYFFVNKTILKEAGCEVPYGSWTFDQLLEICKACAKPEEGIYGLVDFCGTWKPETWLVLNGSNVFSDDLSSCVINSEAAVAAMDFVRKMIYEEKVMPEPSVYASTPADQLFRDGKAAFAFNGTWMTQYLRVNNESIDFEWDVIYPPTGPNATKDAAYAYSCGLFIPANCTDVETAWEVLKFWGSVEGLDGISIGCLATLPVGQANIDSQAYYTWPELPPENFNKAFIEGLFERAAYMPFSHMTLNNNVTNAISSLADILISNKPAQEVCDAAYETIMSQWNSIKILK